MADKIKVVPVAPIRWWQLIHYKELYKGPYEILEPDDINLERLIPKVGWWVCDESSFFLVTNVLADNTSTLSPIYPGQGENYINIITGPAVHQYTSPFRLMVDVSTTPIRMRPDDAMLFNGSEPLYYKVFKGTDITIEGNIVSTAVDANGNPTSGNLMLERIKGANSANDLVKVCRGGHLTEVLANQEVVTIVAYRADGLQVDYRPAVVCYTQNMAPLDMAIRQVVSIAIETPFLNQDNKFLIDVPVNMLIDSTVIFGIATYNDGTIKRLPIDGTKFVLNGLNDFASTVAGSVYDLGLAYKLSDDEVAWQGLGDGTERVMTEDYQIRAINPDGNYTAKLFVVPTWNSTTGAYVLTWFLYNMERKYVYEVTQYVDFTPGFSWNGTRYNQKQVLRVAIDMADVDPYFINYRHVQDVEITLAAPGSSVNQATYYTVAYDDQYTYGRNTRVDITRSTQATNTYNLNIANGTTTIVEWLNKCYYPTEPLFYTNAEDLPPNPTHVVIRNVDNTWRREISIDDVLNPITGVTSPLSQGVNLIFEFSAQTATEKLELSVGSMIGNMFS